MLRRQLVQPGGRRRGVILLVVLALLTLFAIVGLSLVLYADSEATSARIYREAPLAAPNGPDVDLNWAMAFLLGQIIYDVPDNSFGAYSAARGHSLGRLLYGWNNANGALNDKPYNGTGRLAETFTQPALGGLTGQDLVNYTYFSADGFLRDPERLGTRGGLGAANARGPYTGGLNISYTYPDRNNMFLAAVRSDGTVLMPSYYRPWAVNAGDWSSAAGKYKILRPRPAEMGPGFPNLGDPTGDPMGDVKNLAWAPGNNDSIWLDFNAPVMTAPDGTKFKMLVAPLIIDLDGRINLNVHGNIRGIGNAHASNSGWGPWEVSLAQILNVSTAPNEWQNAFVGSGKIAGRYGLGAGSLPVGTAVSGGTMIRRYSPMDFNAVVDPRTIDYTTGSPTPLNPAAGNPTQPIQVPITGNSNVVPYQAFPWYDPTGYGNAVPFETTTDGTSTGKQNHPSIYNAQRPQGANRTLPIRGTFDLLQWSALSSSTRTSDVAQLLTTNLNDTSAHPTIAGSTAGQLRRSLLTTVSYDLDRPGSPAGIWDYSAAPYQFNTTTGFPAGIFVPFQPATTASRSTAVPANSDYDSATWRNALSTLGRIDLGRNLTNWLPPVSGVLDMTQQQNKLALADRQQFAQDIFNVLLRTCGALPPSTAFAKGATSPEYRACRWCAQLAVNLVDYIDSDDYMTPFRWDPTNSPNEYVFGTEKPRLLLNEVYAQWDNVPGDTKLSGTPPVAGTYNVNVWVELHHAFPQELANQDPDQGTVYLQRTTGGSPVYQVVISKPNTNLRTPENVLGTPDAGNAVKTVSDWGTTATTQTVTPNYGAYNDSTTTNKGFYVVGPVVSGASSVYPSGDPWAANPNLTTTFQSASMTYPVLTSDPNPTTTGKPTILLQRLACQHMPPQTNPAAANYNPYVTIDYVENVTVNDGRKYDSAGVNASQVGTTARASVGKKQPMASVNTTAGGFQWVQQNPAAPAANQPLHTFYRHNAVESPAATPPTTVSPGTANQTLQIPFDWQTHLDRCPISTPEIMQVSAYKPHELTQQFVYAGFKYQHLAQWTNSSTRLYRFLDFASVRSWAGGVARGGRVPGKVNINTIWDVQTLRALADRQTSNLFTAADVDTVFANLIANRSPTGAPGGGQMPGASDVPYLGVGLHPSPGSDPISPGPTQRSIENTILRSAPGGTGARMLEGPSIGVGSHPYVRNELLTKLYDRLTTRSNVFGIWMTIGFFQVMDDTVLPVKLGAEIVGANGKPLRHQLFAIVDRTALQVWPTGMVTSTAAVTVPGSPAVPGQPLSVTQNVALSATSVTNPNTGFVWQLQQGAVLTYEPDTDNEETVIVGAGPNFQATFWKSHAAGVQVISRGNPGPWRTYNPQNDTAVVLYTAILK